MAAQPVRQLAETIAFREAEYDREGVNTEGSVATLEANPVGIAVRVYPLDRLGRLDRTLCLAQATASWEEIATAAEAVGGPEVLTAASEARGAQNVDV